MLPILEPPSLQRWGALTFLSEALFLKEMRTEAGAGPSATELASRAQVAGLAIALNKERKQ
jgi:hypothetical protein